MSEDIRYTDEQLLLMVDSRNLSMKEKERRNYLLLKTDLNGYHQWLVDERKLFGEWFQSLIALSYQTPGSGPLGSCLLRDVVRDSKEAMWENWLKLGPYGKYGE